MSKVAEFYASICEEAGLDACEESSIELVSAAIEKLPRTMSALDVFDTLVDDQSWAVA